MINIRRTTIFFETKINMISKTVIIMIIRLPTTHKNGFDSFVSNFN